MTYLNLLFAGVSTIFEKNNTGSFIFLYNSQSVNFDHVMFSNFMKDISTAAAKYLRKINFIFKFLNK
jgi:hypothetical protein